MSATVWSKFYWSDWLSDAGLRRSSFAARGLWIDMLCIAAQSDPIGYLAVKKVPLSVNDIARMCGGSEPETRTLVEELERNGVLSRDRNGTIYSRRMVRDAKKARTSQNNGKLGGNPKLCNDRGNSGWDNPQDKGGVNTHIPEASSHKPKERKIGGANAPPEKIVSLRPYAFEGCTIKLKQQDLDRWRAIYHKIPDIQASLSAADDYYSANPPKDGKWFFPASRWLEKEHQQVVAQEQQAERERQSF